MVGAALIVTITACEVTQQPPPTGETVSQLPPVAVEAITENSKAAPAVVAVMTWGRGLAPACCMVKSRPFSWTKPVVPTTTLTGIVTELPGAWRSNCPIKTPATNPPLGKLAGTIPTVMISGAVPLDADIVSQLPPSEV